MARLKMSRRRTAAPAEDPQLVVGATPPKGGVRLDRPNQGPPAPEGSYLSMRDFDPQVIQERKEAGL